ncbi:hypothetical protein C8R44DRAFT_741973 [Mycena epipterygia]|nr:hypothetical protein C8R44DRAFT_741973 [Mycena epipterygia]
MASTSQAKPSHWLTLALASGLRFSKLSQAIHGQMSRYFNMSSQLGRLQFNQCQIKEPQELLRENFPLKPWLKPLALAWPGLLLALALAWKEPEPDKAKPKPWLPGQAKPAKH